MACRQHYLSAQHIAAIEMGMQFKQKESGDSRKNLRRTSYYIRPILIASNA